MLLVCLNALCYHQFQIKLSEKASLLEKAEAQIEELTAKINEQQRLIQKLEDDILKVWIDGSWKAQIFACLRFWPLNMNTQFTFIDWMETCIQLHMALMHERIYNLHTVIKHYSYVHILLVCFASIMIT